MHGNRPDTFNYRNLPVFAAYIDRIGAELSNYRRFLVKEHRGPYYIERASITIERDGSIKCPPDYNPTPEEAEAIKAELLPVIASWPVSRGATKKLFQNLEGMTTGTLFAFWDQPRKEILFVQERCDRDDGGKDYWPWTFFSDGHWQKMEPDGQLPFWKPPETRNKAKIMVHEGAKSTLGERILGPIIGDDNTSYPTESEIVDSDYTYWLSHRRLAVVNEIYAGHSSKAYNKLKDIITGRKVSIKQKYMANYTLENWIHILACSNNFNALKLTGDDRRWFIPKVTESKQTETYWNMFNAWLNNEGGLQIIAHWAKEFLKTNASVGPGDAAPSTEAKRVVVEEGYSPGMLLVSEILEGIKERGCDEGSEWYRCIIMDNDFLSLITDQIYVGHSERRWEKASTIRKVAKDCRWFTPEAITAYRRAIELQGTPLPADPIARQGLQHELFLASEALRVALDRSRHRVPLLDTIGLDRPPNYVTAPASMDDWRSAVAIRKELERLAREMVDGTFET